MLSRHCPRSASKEGGYLSIHMGLTFFSVDPACEDKCPLIDEFGMMGRFQIKTFKNHGFEMIR